MRKLRNRIPLCLEACRHCLGTAQCTVHSAQFAHLYGQSHGGGLAQGALRLVQLGVVVALVVLLLSFCVFFWGGMQHTNRATRHGPERPQMAVRFQQPSTRSASRIVWSHSTATTQHTIRFADRLVIKSNNPAYDPLRGSYGYKPQQPSIRSASRTVCFPQIKFDALP